MNIFNNKSLDHYLQTLPDSVYRYIFEFVFGNIFPFTLTNEENNYSNSHYETNYNPRYKKVLDKNGYLFVRPSNATYFLSAIPKKNHIRFYITKEEGSRTCDACGFKSCSSYYCKGEFSYESYVSSFYVGKILEYAYLELINNKKNWSFNRLQEKKD